MIALPGITIQDTLYESAPSLVYQGTRDDRLAIVIKQLQEEYPLPQALTRYRQAYVIPRPERSRQGTQPVSIVSRHRMSQGALSAMYEEAT